MTELAQDDAHTPVPLLPMFEGKHVDGSALKITSSAFLELGETVLGVDDIVQIVVEARVNDVAFKVHEPTGRLFRIHTAKALNARLQPYNPAYDEGISHD